MDSQIYEIGKALRPIFTDPVTFVTYLDSEILNKFIWLVVIWWLRPFTEIKVNTISLIASMNSLAHMMHFVVY